MKASQEFGFFQVIHKLLLCLWHLYFKRNIQHVPDSYILPPETRPGNLVIPPCKGIPVLELYTSLNCNRQELIQTIMKATKEFGFFQIKDHGVPDELMCDVLKLTDEFFHLPMEDRARLYSVDRRRNCRLYTSIDYDKERVHFWRDNLRHTCHPLEDHVKDWPGNPVRYREVMGRYAVHMRELSLLLLDLICEGLGLESGYFDGLAKVQLMSINHYPACPDPSLTLGLPKHADANLITLLNQGLVPGLQVLKEEEWLAVDPIPNAFVVNIGHVLQIISNGKLRSVDHRVVTNAQFDRTTIASFTHPSVNTTLEPAPALVSNTTHSRPLYRPLTYSEFFKAYAQDVPQGRHPLERFELYSL